MQTHSGRSSGTSTPRAASRQTSNDASLLSLLPHKRLSLQHVTNTSLLPSPGLRSPRPEPRRTPSSPHLSTTSNNLRRSSSVASMSRSSSPALVRKSSTSSLRGDMPGTPRRSSFVPNMPSPIGGTKSPGSLPPPLEEKPPLRACDVADQYFQKDLARHGNGAGPLNAGTIVIIHDQCYGHRFSRPKTPKSHLSLIMERPERMLAGVLGISAAYVRLGDRHNLGNHAPHPDHSPPALVPFKIRKTSRMADITSPVVTNVHGTKWMAELNSLCDNAAHKLASTGKELARDAPAIPGHASQELHAGDLYLCSESKNAFQGALGGVLDAVDAVFQTPTLGLAPSRAFVCIRPPGHHCSDDFPSGFCWLNNVHVGIEHAMMQYGLTHAAIIDFDLHHGDGSQAITWARNKKVQNMSKNTANWKKTSIGYFSLHDINSYPCEDGDNDKVQAASLCIENAHGQSIWNVHLQPWATPEEFWKIYEDKYLILLEKARQYLKFHTNRLRTTPNHPAPKSAIFLSAGFDASEWETAGMQRHSVNVPTEFYARFTRDVVHLAEEEGTGTDGRVISVLEGGYSDRALTSGVLSHLSGLCDGQVWSESKHSKGLAFDMHQRLGGLSIEDNDTTKQPSETGLTPVTYDPVWWHATQLTELENLVDPPPAVAPKKPRTDKSAHFSSPTQSFTAKVIDPSKLSRTLAQRHAATPSRAPTPPPPEVDWATATHALSRLLIPSDRQTRSHKPEDLAEPKVRKEKPVAPALDSVRPDPSGRQLRGRKAVTSYVDPDSDDEKSPRAESKASRRQTIADFPVASTELLPPPARSASRRMSIASSVSSIGNRSVSREPSVTARRSAAPAQAPANGVSVKKARGTTAAATSRAPQRPPVPRVPSNYTSKTNGAKGKENDDMEALTTGLKRITLKLPSKEEYEAREKAKDEKQKALDASKKATNKTTTRKASAARTTTTTATKTAATTKPAPAKRGPGRPPKSSKPPSPVETAASGRTPEPPKVLSAATVPVTQPQPIQPVQNPATVEDPSAASRRISGGLEPPAQGVGMTPEQLREQLPKPSFMTMAEAVPDATPPTRADTPPPPPPSSMPEFINYTTQTSGTTSTLGNQSATSKRQEGTQLHWLSPNTEDSSEAALKNRSTSPASKKQALPVFTAKGSVPFAPNGTYSGPGGAPVGMKKEHNRQDLWDVPDTRHG